MEQCKADPCVFRLIRDDVLVVVFCCRSARGLRVSEYLMEEFQTMGGELSWYLGCAFERDREEGVLRLSCDRKTSAHFLDVSV